MQPGSITTPEIEDSNMKKFLITIFTISALLFSACSNMTDELLDSPVCSEGDAATATLTAGNPGGVPAQDPDQKYITVTGSVGFAGAYPQEIVNQLDQDSSAASARTAFPTVSPLGDYYLSVKTTGASEIEGVFSEDKKTYSVTIPVSETEKEYKIVIEAKTSQNGFIVLSGESEEFTISEANPVASKNVVLSAIAEEGGYFGMISLDVTVDSDSGIHSAKFFYTDITGNENPDDATVSGTTYTFAEGSISGSSSSGCLPAGPNRIRFEFYSDTEGTDLVYSFTEVANIFSGLCTNTWVKNGDEPYFTTPDDKNITSCRITKALVESFKLAGCSSSRL